MTTIVVSLVIQMANYFFILFVAHRLNFYDKMRQKDLNAREQLDREIVEDIIRRAIVDTTYNPSNDEDSIIIPHDFIAKDRERLLVTDSSFDIGQSHTFNKGIDLTQTTVEHDSIFNHTERGRLLSSMEG